MFLVAVPSGFPQDIQAEAQGPRSLFLSWSPPPPGERNGEILQYKVNITEEETGSTSHYFTHQPHLTVTPLHPFYSYSYTVTAFTEVGHGPYSPPGSIPMPADRECSHSVPVMA